MRSVAPLFPRWTWLLFGVVALLNGACWYDAWRDCRGRGVLIRDAVGMPTCVQAGAVLVQP